MPPEPERSVQRASAPLVTNYERGFSSSRKSNEPQLTPLSLVPRLPMKLSGGRLPLGTRESLYGQSRVILNPHHLLMEMLKREPPPGCAYSRTGRHLDCYGSDPMMSSASMATVLPPGPLAAYHSIVTVWLPRLRMPVDRTFCR